jgi:Na+/H+ antiporter NhaD/arsenite permease-like protein
MLTPFGNPQNLYIYTKFNIPTDEFIGIMLFPFLLSIALFTVACLFIPAEALTLRGEEKERPAPKRTAFYLALFALTILMVFRVVPHYVCLPVVFIAVLVADRRALAKVDYPLLLTFVCFFLLAGNVARIEAVSHFFSSLLEGSTLLTSILSCQVISNVPSAILLSQFTQNYRELLLGVNIGGVGTLIASLASLITFREYVKNNPGKTGKYILEFSLFNFEFLIILLVVMSLV